MKGRAILLLFLMTLLISVSGYGQELPFAEILTEDSAWCQQSNNLSTAEILITGDIDTSRFDLVISLRGNRDTLVNLSSGIFILYLNNQPGVNEYVIHKIIERQTYNTLENEVHDTLHMIVNPWPDMTFNAEYASQCSPATVTFRAREGYPSYTWDLGEGPVVSTTSNWISHTYSSGEDVDELIFDTRLKVVTDAGCADSVSSHFTLHPTPTAGFTVENELLFYPDTTVYLTNTTSAGDWDFKWDFGDASRNFTRDPGEHVYRGWGIFNIVLEWSSNHCNGTVSKQIEIRPPAPRAVFSPDTAGCPPLEVAFTNYSLYADSYRWDFDDGSFSTEARPTHSFLESKDHHVKLIATGLSGKDSSEQIIRVYEQPFADFEPDVTSTSNLEEISFRNRSLNAISYLWDFGDGHTSEEENPSHMYAREGNYTITLYAWSLQECVDTLLRENLMSISPGEGSSEFPSAFRWNGSGPTGGAWTPGNNDNTVFHPNVENATALRMVIFNRVGHRVFESNELYVGWDGYIDSSVLAVQGVYIYKAWITYASGEQIVLSGDLTFLH